MFYKKKFKRDKYAHKNNGWILKFMFKKSVAVMA